MSKNPEDATHRKPAAAQKLPAASSLLLDLVRFSAALIVLAGHITQPFFSGALPYFGIAASSAVAVFFVLSGFIIRYVTLGRENNLRRYTIDRASRVYSVALPALAITALCDFISDRANPYVYFHYWSAAARHPILRLGLNLSFLSQSWFQNLAFYSNTPYWSLSYECVFYAVYGVVFFMAGRNRLLALAIIFLLIGPSVFLLLPIWLLGCLSYDVYAAGTFSRRHTLQFLALSSAISIVSLGSLLSLSNHAIFFFMGGARYTPGIVAIPAALAMLVGCWYFETFAINERHWLVRTLRRVSASTFALYLIHFPLLVLVAMTVPYNHQRIYAQMVAAAAIIAVSILLAAWFDNFKITLRTMLSRCWPAKPGHTFHGSSLAQDCVKKGEGLTAPPGEFVMAFDQDR